MELLDPQVVLAAANASRQALLFTAAARCGMAQAFMVELMRDPEIVGELTADDPVAVLDKAADLAVTAADRLLERLKQSPGTTRPY